MGLSLSKEIFTIQGLVLVCNGLSIVRLGVLEGLDRDSAVERSSGEEVRVVRVPASLEGPVCDNGEFAIGLAGLRVPADVAVVLAGREKEVGVLVTPGEREHTRLVARKGLKHVSGTVSK